LALLSRLPLITLGLGLVVFTFTLVLSVTSGLGFSQPTTLLFIVPLAFSILLMFMAQNPNNERAALMYWFTAGVWGAASYLNFQLLGLFYLVVAVLAAFSAFLIERESRTFSFIGPGLFLGVGLLLVVLATFLAR
jgi:hypothetical protein